MGLLLLERVKKSGINNLLIGYKTSTKGSAILKSSTVSISDSKNRIIGCLCINVDILSYLAIQSIFDKMCRTVSYPDGSGEDKFPEKFEVIVNSLINDLVGQNLKKIGKPLGHMQKEDKLRVIRDLKERGLFLIKGAAKRVSGELNVSLPAVYKYLEEI